MVLSMVSGRWVLVFLAPLVLTILSSSGVLAEIKENQLQTSAAAVRDDDPFRDDAEVEKAELSLDNRATNVGELINGVEKTWPQVDKEETEVRKAETEDDKTGLKSDTVRAEANREGTVVEGAIAVDKTETDLIDGYEKVKETLRSILDNGVYRDVKDKENTEEETLDDGGIEPTLIKKSMTNFPEERRRQLMDFTGTYNRRPIKEPEFEVLRDERPLLTGKYEQYGSQRSAINHHHSGHEDTKEYLNEWVVRLTGGMELARSVAKDLGYDFLGQVGNFKDVYRLVKRDHPAIHKRSAPELTHRLNVHAQVKWAEQQFAKERAKRSDLPQTSNDHGLKYPYSSGNGVKESLLPKDDTEEDSYDLLAPLGHMKRAALLRPQDDVEQESYDPFAPRVRVKRVQFEEELEEELMKTMNDEHGEKYRARRGERSVGKMTVGENTHGENSRLMKMVRAESRYGVRRPMTHRGNKYGGQRWPSKMEQEERKRKESHTNRMARTKGKQRMTLNRVAQRSAMTAHAQEMERLFNDELWVHQWYLFDTRTRADLPKLDLQVVPVWEAGITGKGIRIVVLDDGLEWTHTDITQNYDADISYDYNAGDADPSPRYEALLLNSHGTRCAGEIAMAPNNRKCGVGVAYGASVGGIRMLDGPVSDVVEGSSLSHALDKVDIFSSSWGPTDDGKRVEGPGRLAEMALLKGITEGRNGKGVVYVWAAGNGGSVGDDCNCDGYTSSIYTLSVSSASETGRFPWYGERCSSTLAAAYSSGAYTDQKIATTDVNDTCTDKFSGTSAAAPLAAGILALALEANPELTWRDVQHAVVWSSEWAPLSHNSGWQTNARGLKFNPRFGFGLLNARGVVHLVKSNWLLVPKKVECAVESSSISSNTLSSGDTVMVEFHEAGCKGTPNEIRSLEHVQVITNVNYTRRGALSITLTSPGGTLTTLLNERVEDASTKGFKNWPLMSVHTWGEDPRGVWELEIAASNSSDEDGVVGDVRLVLHGTKEIPKHMQEPRSYSIPLEGVQNGSGEELRSQQPPEGQRPLTAGALRSLPWGELVKLMSQRSRTPNSAEEIELLLRENRLEDALRLGQSERDGGTYEDSDWWKIAQEIVDRR